MATMGISRIRVTILLTIAIFSLSLPSYAKYSGGTGDPNDPYQIATAEDLMTLGETPEDYDKHFILTTDIDLDPNLPGCKVFDRAVIASDANDVADGFQGTPFTGLFDGNDHTISNLTIVGNGYLGLFGQSASEAEIRDMGVVDVNIVGSGSYIGGLVGTSAGSITTCYSTGTVSGSKVIGGLVGKNSRGNISASYSNAAVSGVTSIGGLIGYNWGGSVTYCYSIGTVMATGSDGGGLVGSNFWISTVSSCYSGGTVSGGSGIGGFVGENSGKVIDCYSMSETSGDNSVGGLVGLNKGPGGRGELKFGFVSQCYSTGAVSGTGSFVGGLVGEGGHVMDSFWDTQTSGQATSDGGTGKTTAEMQDPNTFRAAGWDFVGQADGPHDMWAIPESGGYLIFCWQLPPGFGLPTFSGGTGEPNDPYRIATPTELNRIGHNPRLMGAHFNIVEDIGLKGMDFYVIGSELYPFTGLFDGNGHTVSHLTIAGSNYLGMFGQLSSGAELTNIVIEDVNIAGTGDYIGGLVGQNDKGTVKYCCSTGWISGDSRIGGLVGVNSGYITSSYSIALVTGAGYVGGLTGGNSGVIVDCNSTGSVSSTGAIVGGLIGSNSGSVIQCYSTGSVTGSRWTGGLVGYNSNGTMSKCFSVGSVSGDSDVGGLVGENGSDVTQCYSTGSVNGNSTIGGLVGRNSGNVAKSYSTGLVSGSAFVGGLVGRDDECPPRVTHSVWDIEASSQSGSAGGVGLTTREMMDPQMLGLNGFSNDPNWVLDAGRDYPRLAWEGTPGSVIPEPNPNVDWLEGLGTPENPYRINTADQIMLLVKMPILLDKLWNKHFLLVADIDLDPNLPGRRIFGEAVIPVFGGVFDGNGHVLLHLTIRGECHLGFIGRLESDAEVKDLGMVDVNITGSDYRGGIGGLVGYNYKGTVSNSFSTGSVTGPRFVGGLVGANDHGTVTQCYSTSMINPGYPQEPSQWSQWYREGFGGLVGTSSGSITKSYSTGTVRRYGWDYHVGGLVGVNSGSITASYSISTVSGYHGVGGLVGSNEGTVSSCHSTSAVSSDWYVGGLVGNNDSGSIRTSYSSGSVSGNAYYAGGLVGNNGPNGSTINCYSIAKVSGRYYVGGLVGENKYYDYRDDTEYEGIVTGSFWDTQTSGQASSDGGTGLTTAEMQTASIFLDAGWDFVDETVNGTDDIWWILEGQDYPRLWWELISGN